MAEEPRPLIEGCPEGGAYDPGPRDDIGRMREDIERTREQMGGTIDELQQRLRPSSLISRATDPVRGASGWIQSHPLSAATAIIGVAWALSRPRPARRPQSRYQQVAHDGRTSQRRPGTTLGAFAAGAAAAALLPSMSGPSARAVARSARSMTEDGRRALRRVRDRAGDVRVAVARMRRSVRGGDVQHRLENWLDEDPLAVGAVAALAGVLVGVSLPMMQVEHRVLGDARDALAERAADAVRGLRAHAGAVAREVVTGAARTGGPLS